MTLEGQVGTGITIYPGIPKNILVTVLSGETTGTALHHMGTTPRVSRPNPNKSDNAAFSSYATADDTTITVTCDAPVSSDVIFSVDAIV